MSYEATALGRMTIHGLRWSKLFCIDRVKASYKGYEAAACESKSVLY